LSPYLFPLNGANIAIILDFVYLHVNPTMMTTIMINDDSLKENLSAKPYDSYKDLMEDLAELHGYAILWEADENKLPEHVQKSLNAYENDASPKLHNL